MAIPADPVVNTFLEHALRRAGQPNPSTAQRDELKDNGLQEVKTDIRLFAAGHPMLRTTAVDSTIVGVRVYAGPTDLNIMKGIALWDGPDEWRGTAQAGGAATLTGAATLDEDSDTLIGHVLILTGGTGVDQLGYITGYDNGTKVITVSANWTTAPDSTTTYLIANQRRLLPFEVKASGLDLVWDPGAKQLPTEAAVVGETIYLNYAADKIYGLEYDYIADIDRLDEAGTLFIKLLREWRTLFMQGCRLKVMERYDEDRAVTVLPLYKALLDALSNQACSIEYGKVGE